MKCCLRPNIRFCGGFLFYVSMKEKYNKTGQKTKTNQGLEITIVDYINYNNVIITFDNGYTTKVRYDHFKSGSIKNPYHKSVYGVGYLGEGSYKVKINGKLNSSYTIWAGMLRRCYSHKHQINNPSYVGCKVSEGWHNFQNFAKWFEENYVEGWHLDKDILIKGNRVYSLENCCFIPMEINSLFTKTDSKRGILPIGVSEHTKGSYSSSVMRDDKKHHIGLFKTPEEAFEAYKIEKEKYIKEVADKWKDLIEPRVYEAMYNYKVEIDD